jgi:hypothetical protein
MVTNEFKTSRYTYILTLSDRTRKAAESAAALAAHRSLGDAVFANDVQTKEDEEDDREEEWHHEEDGSQRGMHQQSQDPCDGVAVQNVLESRKASLLSH